ncbi:MAG TPA: ABC transporter permease [Gemmatimonadaceae bacterium]|jgi:predicted permease
MPSARWHRYLRFWGSTPDAEVDDELRFHVEMRAQELRDRGVTDIDAREQARALFGDVASVRDECQTINRRLTRRTRRQHMLDGFWSDVRFALRTLRSAPVFTTIAIATLALGIGANAVIFSLADAVVLRPIPGVRAPRELFDVVTTPLSYPAFLDQRTADSSIADITAYRARQLAVRSGETTTMLPVAMVAGNYFSLLGASAARGRLLGPADDQPAAPATAVVSDTYWRTTLNADPNVIGRAIFVSGAQATIVGVAAPEFHGTRLVSVPVVWVPISVWPAIRPTGLASLDITNRGWGWLQVMGRLRPGHTLAQAHVAMSATSAREHEEFPNSAATPPSLEVRASVGTVAGRDAAAPLTSFIVVLASVAALVLLIACVNVANLLLARMVRRRAEIALRIALGAERSRVIRQLVTESVVLGAASSAAAIGLAAATLRVLRSGTFPGGISLAATGLSLDGAALGFSLGVTMLTVMLFGVVPAFYTARSGERAALSDRSGAGSQSSSRLRDALLVVQVALSLVLLIGAGLFARGLQRALTIDLGFQPEHIATAAVNTGLVRYDTARAIAYLQDARSKIAALPGVSNVAWTVTLPISDHNSLGALIEGVTPPKGQTRDGVTVDIVSPGYIAALGGRMTRGRDIAESDRQLAPHVAVVNETFARKYWPNEDPIGKRIIIEDTMTVVGVAHDIKVEQLEEPPTPVVYQSLWQQPRWALDGIHVVARTHGDPELLLPTIDRALRSVGSDVPVFALRSFGDQLDEILLPQRLGVQIIGAFSLLALIVAGVGMYGVVAYMVGQRTREIGVRIALGAPSRSVLGMVLTHNLRRVTLGIVLGLIVGALGTRALQAFLFGLSAHDAVTYAATSLILFTVGAVAAFVPAWRATKVSPLMALRSD